MKPDEIHVAGMILLLVATVGVTARFGRKTLKNVFWNRLLIAISAGVITFFALPMGMIVQLKSQASSNPAYQSLLTSLCLIIVILCIEKRIVAIISCLVILITGYKLCSQYQYIVNHTGKYAYADPLSGEFFNYPSYDSWSKGVSARPLWHTSFTGIYSVEGLNSRNSNQTGGDGLRGAVRANKSQ
ncbi:hypothetical protein KP001_01375 [Geomonas subterranea]|uniref:Uncharacterized protein n=1 Tax=Geomonas subterranea TaxID=2847989 RepID=A0ABX8LGR4_9BACT|nr:hypothetical protein [Geomonas subterranea]QXE91220.1 hypothetical protein KP001_01375 [Geomonas subterranea]QXM10693.1 hypothetical protein KP002_06115 [Geomonas subterranea]